MNVPLTDITPPQGARFVVGVDGSEPSRKAVRWAQWLAGLTGGVIELVAAWEPVSSYGWAGVGAGMSVVPVDWNPAMDAEKVLEQTVDEVFGAHRPPGLELVTRSGHPAKVLVDASVGAGMLLVGSRGHGGFSGLLLGSVSTACAEHAHCPVLVLHGDTLPPPSAKDPA